MDEASDSDDFKFAQLNTQSNNQSRPAKAGRGESGRGMEWSGKSRQDKENQCQKKDHQKKFGSRFGVWSGNVTANGVFAVTSQFNLQLFIATILSAAREGQTSFPTCEHCAVVVTFYAPISVIAA